MTEIIPKFSNTKMQDYLIRIFQGNNRQKIICFMDKFNVWFFVLLACFGPLSIGNLNLQSRSDIFYDIFYLIFFIASSISTTFPANMGVPL